LKRIIAIRREDHAHGQGEYRDNLEDTEYRAG
jgi:hypothetical protein